MSKNSWTKSADGTQAYSVANIVEEPITIYMLWVPETYEIVYYSDGTFSEDKTVVDFGTNLYKYLDPEAKNAPTRVGYNFVGWATASDDLQKSFPRCTHKYSRLLKEHIPIQKDPESAENAFQPSLCEPSQN